MTTAAYVPKAQKRGVRRACLFFEVCRHLTQTQLLLFPQAADFSMTYCSFYILLHFFPAHKDSSFTFHESREVASGFQAIIAFHIPLFRTYPRLGTPRKRKGERKMANSSNKIVVPAARDAMDRFKMEAANDVGVTLKQGYNGDISARQAGSIGGQMVKKMIEAYENGLK
jgi:hypothetical protein